MFSGYQTNYVARLGVFWIFLRVLVSASATGRAWQNRPWLGKYQLRFAPHLVVDPGLGGFGLCPGPSLASLAKAQQRRHVWNLRSNRTGRVRKRKRAGRKRRSRWAQRSCSEKTKVRNLWGAKGRSKRRGHKRGGQKVQQKRNKLLEKKREQSWSQQDTKVRKLWDVKNWGCLRMSHPVLNCEFA